MEIDQSLIDAFYTEDVTTEDNDSDIEIITFSQSSSSPSKTQKSLLKKKKNKKKKKSKNKNKQPVQGSSDTDEKVAAFFNKEGFLDKQLVAQYEALLLYIIEENLQHITAIDAME
ncbi:hypothetical protein RclHR1_14320001 [Rhizophagus clarus]|uniref:Uncharacterized protein n=1 Tax=Rhizophagus clarus TaxID=94130 RepID=A0A2Z6QRX7_9GLOM|nr:hypothetical protein RclHR1_14320001 [Rhizophagus clarus]GES80412.1 hypothetical protein RCL_jg22364.t1 [Rhizophagus clarus]